MRCRLVSIVFGTLLFIASGAAAEPARVPNPEQFSDGIFLFIQQAKFHEAALRVSETVGKPEFVPQLESALKILDGKKFDFGKKVFDKEYNGALRQLVYYSYFENLGFIYFRFTFKMTSKGWMLTNFFFKDAAQDLFPKDLIEGPAQ